MSIELTNTAEGSHGVRVTTRPWVLVAAPRDTRNIGRPPGKILFGDVSPVRESPRTLRIWGDSAKFVFFSADEGAGSGLGAGAERGAAEVPAAEAPAAEVRATTRLWNKRER